MAFNIFKRSKKKDKELAEKKAELPVAREKRIGKKEALVQPNGLKTKKPAKQASEIAYRVLIQPHITEKASILAQDNRYLFKVFQSATKGQVARAVKDVYDVNVKSVRMIRIPSKKVRLGRRREGIKKGYKKAIVQLQQGQKLEIMPR